MGALKVISIWNPKGGQGKSMLAINIAAAAVEMGMKPLIVDQDQQGTSMKYYQSNSLPFEVVGHIPQTKPDADLVIIDHQASDWTLPDGDLVIMPVKPARDQYETYQDAKAMIEQAGKQIFTVVTDTNEVRKSERKLKGYLVSQGAKDIPSSGVFSRASDSHVSIFDQSMNKAYKVANRRKEIMAILCSVLKDTENSTMQSQSEQQTAQEKILESA